MVGHVGVELEFINNTQSNLVGALVNARLQTNTSFTMLYTAMLECIFLF